MRGAEAPGPRTGSISPDPAGCWVPGEVTGAAQTSGPAWPGCAPGSAAAPGGTGEFSGGWRSLRSCGREGGWGRMAAAAQEPGELGGTSQGAAPAHRDPPHGGQLLPRLLQLLRADAATGTAQRPPLPRPCRPSGPAPWGLRVPGAVTLRLPRSGCWARPVQSVTDATQSPRRGPATPPRHGAKPAVCKVPPPLGAAFRWEEVTHQLVPRGAAPSWQSSPPSLAKQRGPGCPQGPARLPAPPGDTQWREAGTRASPGEKSWGTGWTGSENPKETTGLCSPREESGTRPCLVKRQRSEERKGWMREKEDVRLAEETPKPGTSRAGAPPRGLLSYRRHSCRLLGLCTHCRSLGTRGRALLRGVSHFGGLWDLLAHCRRALGETAAVRGTAAIGANWGHCWVLGRGVKTHKRRHLLPVLCSIFGGQKWPGSTRPEGRLLLCGVRNDGSDSSLCPRRCWRAARGPWQPVRGHTNLWRAGDTGPGGPRLTVGSWGGGVGSVSSPGHGSPRRTSRPGSRPAPCSGGFGAGKGLRCETPTLSRAGSMAAAGL